MNRVEVTAGLHEWSGSIPTHRADGIADGAPRLEWNVRQCPTIRRRRDHRMANV